MNPKHTGKKIIFLSIFRLIAAGLGLSISLPVASQQTDTFRILQSIDSLIRRQNIYLRQEKIDSALLQIDTALACVETLGKNHRKRGHLLHSKGYLLTRLGLWQDAEQVLLESLAIKMRHEGEQGSTQCITLNQLGNVFLAQRDLETAERYYTQAKLCYTANQETKEIGYGYVLNNLAMVYAATGRYHQARQSMTEAILVKESLANINQPDYVGLSNSYVELSRIYGLLGDIPRMEKARAKSIALLLEAPPTRDIHFYWRKNNLGNYYLDAGESDKALQHYQESLEGKKALLDPFDPDIGKTLINISNAYLLAKNFPAALQANREAYYLFAKDSARHALDLAWCLNNIGLIYISSGETENAKPYILRSLQIKKILLGAQDPDYNGTYLNLISIFIQEGKLDTAEMLLTEQLKLYNSDLAEMQQLKKNCLHLLGDVYGRKKSFEKGRVVAAQLIKETREPLDSLLKFNIPSVITSHIPQMESALDRYLSLYTLDTASDSAFAAGCMDLALYQKGLILESARLQHQQIQASSALKELTDAIRYNAYCLKKAYHFPATPADTLAKLEAWKKVLESEYAALSGNQSGKSPGVTWQDIRQRLRKGEAAIELLRFHYNLYRPTDSTIYIAILMKPDIPRPILIPLFEESALLQIIQHTQTNTEAAANSLYDQTSGNPSNLSLYHLGWQPMAPYLRDVNTIYCSPTGLFHRINLSALQLPDGQRVSDIFNFVLLGSTRQLMEHDRAAKPGIQAVLVGGVDFDADTFPNLTVESTSPIPLNDVASITEPTFVPTVSRGEAWTYLPGTQKEIAQVAGLLKQHGLPAVEITGRMATEENVSSACQVRDTAGSPYILHLSTHGYFFPDPVSNPGPLPFGHEPFFKTSEYPMIRSGLILAGGNYAWKNGHTIRPGMEDGILTAYEISQMDLRNTELVVLSACDTGLGDIQGNEGVFGLQRAFKIAGVKNLIMSLWKVPDAATKELMISFYRHWLEDNMTIRQALYTAQREMREEGWELYDWAGFVLVE